MEYTHRFCEYGACLCAIECDAYHSLEIATKFEVVHVVACLCVLFEFCACHSFVPSRLAIRFEVVLVVIRTFSSVATLSDIFDTPFNLLVLVKKGLWLW